jgi:hypothetical protein
LQDTFLEFVGEFGVRLEVCGGGFFKVFQHFEVAFVLFYEELLEFDDAVLFACDFDFGAVFDLLHVDGFEGGGSDEYSCEYAYGGGGGHAHVVGFGKDEDDVDVFGEG